MNNIRITETALRDAHQSLYATRMKVEHMLPILEKLDEIGYFSLEMWGGATFDSCIRYLGEDPWERVTKIKSKLKKTKLQMLVRGQNLLGYKHYSDDIVEKFISTAAKRGIDIFRIFDALNDLRNIRSCIDAVKKAGKHAQGCVSYTISPVHTNENYVKMAKEIENMGADSLCIKDMAGLLTPKNAYDLIKSIKASIKIPIQLHSHYTSGMASATYLKAAEAGCDVIDTAISSLGFKTSQPGTESMVQILKGFEFETGLDLEKLTEINEYFREIRDNYLAKFGTKASDVDINVLLHQVPGGMISNLANQLKAQDKLDLLPKVLIEIANIREDLGYPPLVTPSSQLVGTQATFNILQDERYKIILEETKNMFLGKYGTPPGEVNQELKKKAIGDEKEITCRPADLLEPSWEKYKKEIGDTAKSDEDVLTYAMFPEIGKKFLEARNAGDLESIREKPQEKVYKNSENLRVKVNGRVYDIEVES